MCFSFGEAGDEWLNLPSEVTDAQGLQLTRQILYTIPELSRSEAQAAVNYLAETLADSSYHTLYQDFLDESLARDLGRDIAKIDGALTLSGSALLLQGWLAVEADEIERLELVCGARTLDIRQRIVRRIRPDLFEAFPWSRSSALGFILLVDEPELLGYANMKLRVHTRRAGRQVVQFTPGEADWPVLLTYLNAHPELVSPVTRLLTDSPVMRETPNFEERLTTLLRSNFLTRHPAMPVFIENPVTTLAAIDRVYALGEAGLLIFGWHYQPKLRPDSITVWGPEGQSVAVTEGLFPLVRHDLVQAFKDRYPGITDHTGFVCLAPLPTYPGEARALCFGFGEGGDVWLKLPSELSEISGIPQIKAILGTIPVPEKMMHSLHGLFESGLGDAIEAIGTGIVVDPDVSFRQYGDPPENPKVSVIVPLYGRYDFLRHQLAQFVDDPDFDEVDLIYVIDDPSIISAVQDLATRSWQVFGKPFRTVWYGENLGFASANNIGARLARAGRLLLLNSDVLPQEAGWLGILSKALDELPNAGTVGPLLQFSDNAVQHAGMDVKRDPRLPGFLLNIHPGKGLVWSGGDQPIAKPMLTAACVMLRTEDFRAVKGFDEGYIIGDFEDSDLCLKLSRIGRQHWLVPAARLWHLERQSQNHDGITSVRQLITLFNAWRYQKKIEKGEISNPETIVGAAE